MTSSERPLASRRALVPSARPAVDPVAEAQAALAELLAEVGALDAEVEALSAELARFAVEVERRLGPPDAVLARAAGLVRRLRTLAEGLEQERARLAAGRGGGRPARRAKPPRGEAARGGATGRTAGGARGAAWDEPEEPAAGGPAGEVSEEPVEVPTAEKLAAELKQLYRRLARLLHPDLAQGDGERRRLGELMSKVNAAWAAQDRAALELMAEKVGAGEPPGDLTVEERQAHLARRREQLTRVASSLRRERERLARTETARLWREASARREAGRDLLIEEEAALQAEAAAAGADALARLDALAAAARRLGRERRGAMSETRKQGGAVVRRAFDPLSESALVRRSAARLDLARAGAPARALARWLEEAATRSPWEAGLTVLAFLLEVAGDRPPPAVAEAAGLAARWEVMRSSWAGAPPLAEALARAPRHVVIGARLGQEEVLAGPQLSEAGLAAGVRLALEHGAVAEVARAVLLALGPEERCGSCRRPVLGLHLLRTRGLDERHGIVCPRCGRVLRSYWRYGEAEGLEALAPISLALGLVEEQPLALGGAALGFQLLPEERGALTARGLLARFAELYLEPYQAPVEAAALGLVQGTGAKARPLASKAPLAGVRVLSLRIAPEAGVAEVGLLELLRTRIERRFRPGG